MDKEDVLDHACLHLAFYLASWGMMRGGTFLLQKDYRIHEYFRRAVVAGSSTYRLYDLRTNELTVENVEGIDGLIQQIEKAYIQNITQINGGNVKISITDTLTSKILLGVYGNAPAYDRYLRKALTLHGINAQLNEKSLVQLADFYNSNKQGFEQCHQMFAGDDVKYTPMKLIDMYFWQVGFMMDTIEEDNEELDSIYAFAENYRTSLQRGKSICTGSKNGKGTTNFARDYLVNILNVEKAEGHISVDLKSGDIHRKLNLKNNMPTVCSAMTSLNPFKDIETIHDTPSGKSSTKVIRYYL